jgi:hypothetical protein
MCFFLSMTYSMYKLLHSKLDRHTGISLADNFFLSEFQIHKILVRTFNQLKKIRVPDSAPDPEQALDPDPWII